MSPISRPKNPLVVIPMVAGIGNALMAAPMVRQLKLAWSDARILIMARTEAMGQVFERMSEVEQVRPLGRSSGEIFQNMWRVRTLRPHLFIAPFPSNRWQYSMLAMASGAERKILHSYPVGNLRTMRCCVGQKVEARRGIHDVVQNLALLQLLGIEMDDTEPPRFILTDADRQRATAMMQSVGIVPEQRPIAVHPGSARTVLAEAKRWPPSSYAKLIPIVRDRFASEVVVLEGPDELGVAEEIEKHLGAKLRVIRLCGALADAAAILEKCRIYVGSDSGLGHLSAAVGTTPVTIFAPADPDRVCPFGYRHLVVRPNKACSPCLMYPFEATRPRVKCTAPMCVGEVTVEEVLRAAGEAIPVGSAGG
ncbi:MAG TPA: glycosyltransferase family 9 protein [Tepidisphaeraceae bacterium]|jgi:heptosyltransferase-2|nr:glycosyltransferase family 9 protein [Tepidisphaeraceae bacterium]